MIRIMCDTLMLHSNSRMYRNAILVLKENGL